MNSPVMPPSLKMEIAEVFTSTSRALRKVDAQLENVRQALVKSRSASPEDMTKIKTMQIEIEKFRNELESMMP
jgi:hypothetical protein